MIEFSTGIMPSAQAPDFTASNASSKTAYGRRLVVGKCSRQASSLLAPGSPWKAILGRSRSWGSEAVRAAKARAASRSAGVSTEIGVSSTTAAQIDRPSSSARSCSSFSRCSSGEGGAAAEPLQRRAAVGVDADVLPDRPVAVEHRAGEVERPAARLAVRAG